MLSVEEVPARPGTPLKISGCQGLSPVEKDSSSPGACRPSPTFLLSGQSIVAFLRCGRGLVVPTTTAHFFEKATSLKRLAQHNRVLCRGTLINHHGPCLRLANPDFFPFFFLLSKKFRRKLRSYLPLVTQGAPRTMGDDAQLNVPPVTALTRGAPTFESPCLLVLQAPIWFMFILNLYRPSSIVWVFAIPTGRPTLWARLAASFCWCTGFGSHNVRFKTKTARWSESCNSNMDVHLKERPPRWFMGSCNSGESFIEESRKPATRKTTVIFLSSEQALWTTSVSAPTLAPHTPCRYRKQFPLPRHCSDYVGARPTGTPGT